MTKEYVIFTADDLDGLTGLGITRLMVELSPTGQALREIGFDSGNVVVHRFPGQGSFGKRGLFDNEVVSMSQLKSDLSPDSFNSLFEMAGPARD